MATSSRPRSVGSRPTPLAARLLAAAGGVVLFFGVASIIDPSRAPANSGTPSIATPAGQGALRDGLLCTLVGPNYTVEVFAGDPDPVYSVYDAAGNQLADRAPKEEIYRIDPSLDPDSMMGPAIGLVDPVDF